jgi:hypothetical protein
VAYLLAPAKVYTVIIINPTQTNTVKFLKPEHTSEILQENPIERENNK